jgi:SAM-dependent methyltransferase
VTFEEPVPEDIDDGDPRGKPDGIDVERPSPARIYDYALGGPHNFAVDRQVADQVLAVYPEMQKGAYANRAFLRRAVQFLVDAGVRQFLDIGSGIPTVGHVHEIAQAAAPESRVVFVDIDPVAVAHSRDILRGNDRTAVIQEDVRRPEAILEHPDLQQLFALDQPVAVLVVALFHFIPDADDPAGVLSRLTAPLASRSYLAISHLSGDGTHDMATGKQIAQRAGLELTPRSRDQVTAMFGDLELVEPGLVWVPLWRPESPDDLYVDQPEASGVYAGVGRKA